MPTTSAVTPAPSSSTPTSSSSSTPLVSGNATSSLGKDDFIKLLVTQLQNQDPLDPLKDSDFIAQLAQFSSLEGIQQLNTNISSLLLQQQLAQSTGLIGKKITFSVTGSTQPQNGQVDAVNVANGGVTLAVGNQTVALTQLQTIHAGGN
jgi:flagellar basal-body rod modification protein FlgD